MTVEALQKMILACLHRIEKNVEDKDVIEHLKEKNDECEKKIDNS